MITNPITRYVSNNLKYVHDGESIQGVIDTLSGASADNLYQVLVPPGHESEAYVTNEFIQVDFAVDKKIKETILNDCQTAWTGSSINADDSPYLENSNYKDLAAEVSWDGYTDPTPNPMDLSSYDGFYLWVKISGANALNDGGIYFKIKSGTSYFQYRLSDNFDVYFGADKWVKIFLSKDTYEFGSPDWTNITKFVVSGLSHSGERKVSWTKLTAFKSAFHRGYVTFSYDDQMLSVWKDIFPIFQKHKVSATVFVSTKEVGTTYGSGVLDWNELKTLENLGWDIGGHSVDHTDIRSVSNAVERDREINGCKHVLKTNDLLTSNSCYAWPGGNKDLTAVKLAEKSYTFLRGTKDVYNFGINSCVTQRQNLYCSQGTLAETKALVDKTKACKGWLNIYAHNYLMDNMTVADFEELLEYIIAQGIPIVTYSEMRDIMGLSKPLESNDSNFKFGRQITLTDDMLYDRSDGMNLILDPGGANRNIIPCPYPGSGNFPANFEITLINTADAAETLTFDPTFTAAGAHDGVANVATLTDSGESWEIGQLVGRTINNTTDVSSGVITANTATTVTAILSGGTDDDWDVGDNYTITPIGIDEAVAQNQRGRFVCDGAGWLKIFVG